MHRPMVITARTGFFAWLLAITLAAAVPLTCAVWSRAPEPQEVCHDTMEVRTRQQSTFECPVGSRLEVWPAGGSDVLAKCLCGPKRSTPAAPDAGATP